MKGKPSEQTAQAPPKSTSPLVSAVSNASSGKISWHYSMYILFYDILAKKTDYWFIFLMLVIVGSSVPSTTPNIRTVSSDVADLADQYMDDQPAPVSPTSTDGWGELENGITEEQESEKDGWDDMLPLEDEKPSPALANIQAAQKRPVIQAKSQGNPFYMEMTLIIINLSSILASKLKKGFKGKQFDLM